MVHDNPNVGEHLQEHAVIALILETNCDVSLSDDPQEIRGGISQTHGYLMSEWAAEHEPQRGPDFQIAGSAGYYYSIGPMMVKDLLWPFPIGRPRDFLSRLFRNACRIFWDAGKSGFLSGRARRVLASTCQLYHPRSRGWVRLASADPLVLPLVQPNLLVDPIDRLRLRQVPLILTP